MHIFRTRIRTLEGTCAGVFEGPLALAAQTLFIVASGANASMYVHTCPCTCAGVSKGPLGLVARTLFIVASGVIAITSAMGKLWDDGDAKRKKLVRAGTSQLLLLLRKYVAYGAHYIACMCN